MKVAHMGRPIQDKKIQMYLKTRTGFLVLATGPISTGVIWGFRPSTFMTRKKEADG